MDNHLNSDLIAIFWTLGIATVLLFCLVALVAKAIDVLKRIADQHKEPPQ